MDSLRDAPVFLEASGQVACGDAFRWKGKYYYADQYDFCLEFLTRKALPLDVSTFREKDLMDVIEEMADRQTITRKDLIEVAHHNNHIALIKEAVLKDAGSALYRKMYPRRRPSTEPAKRRKR